MYRNLLLLLLGFTILSCSDFATSHNLSPEPASNLVMEMLDRSTTSSSSGTALYTSFTLSDNNWVDYLSSSTSLESPSGYSTQNELSVSQNDNGDITATHTKESNLIQQGDYILELYAGVSSLEETYRYSFNINIDGIGQDYLSAREDDSNTPRTPYICKEIASYKLAVNDGSDTIYISPVDNYSASQELVVLIKYDDDLEYVAILPSVNMQNGKWTAFSQDDLIENDSSPRAISFSEMRDSDSKWSFGSYAMNSVKEDWGTLYRSELRNGVFDATAPASENILEAADNSSRNIKSFTISPLAQKHWDNLK